MGQAFPRGPLMPISAPYLQIVKGRGDDAADEGSRPLNGEFDVAGLGGGRGDADRAFALSQDRQFGKLPRQVGESRFVFLVDKNQPEGLDVVRVDLRHNLYDLDRHGDIGVLHHQFLESVFKGHFDRKQKRLSYSCAASSTIEKISIFTGQERVQRPHPTQEMHPYFVT